MIKVSVLITFYNQEQYVDRTLKSVLSQKVDFPIEILVGDDCSSDNTVEKVETWINKYPSTIFLYRRTKSERNVIPRYSGSENRINLLKHVKGEYFIILDGDDYYSDNDKLRLQVEALDKDENKDCVMCSHYMTTLNQDGSLEETGYVVHNTKISQAEYWKKYYFHTDSMLIRSSVIEKLDLKLLEHNFWDNMLTLSILNHGNIYFIPRNMAVYNKDGLGLWTGNNSINNILITFMNYDMYCMICPTLKFYTSVRFYYFWEEALKIRKQIRFSNFSRYEEDAINKRLKNFHLWIHYDEDSCFERIKMVTKARLIVFISKVVRKIQRIFQKFY